MALGLLGAEEHFQPWTVEAGEEGWETGWMEQRGTVLTPSKWCLLVVSYQPGPWDSSLQGERNPWGAANQDKHRALGSLPS